MRLAGSGLFARALAFCFAASLCTWAGSQTLPPARKEAALPYAPTPPSRSAAGKDTAAQSLIRLDLVVTDKSGKLVTGLEPRDFTLMDNGQPSKILSLRAFNGNSAKPDQPVEVILVIDTIALPDRLASYEKQEVERFLRQNGGRLAHPVSIFWLSDAGLSTLAQPSADGSFLAEEMVHNKQLALTRRALRNTQIGEPLDSLTFDDPPGLTALKALGEIATSERTKPGRKLLLWVGPGWGMGSGKHYFSKLTREQLFEAINWFSTLMREARLVLYSFSVGEADGFNLTMDSGITPPRGLYQDFLKGVKSDREASVDALDRKVLAVQSGGRVLEPADDLRSDILHTGLTDRTPEFDLVKQINSCVGEADEFYALSFNPADTKQTDEYHDLKVEVDKPGLVVRTKTGYYDQPYFYDRPKPAARSITVVELHQMLEGTRGKRDADLAREISDLELTERLSDAKVAAWQSGLRGEKSRAALAALADASHFLDPPAADVPADAAPDLSAQQRMIARAVDYVNKTMKKLPNFFATRTTIRYEETPEHYDPTGRHRIEYEPLHWVDTTKETVLYRNGNEIAQAVEKRGTHNAGAEGLYDKGTFGAILGAVIDAAAVPGDLTWSRWEKVDGGLQAVFRYAIAAGSSRYQVSFCCLPDGDGTRRFRELIGYHGEIAISPANGAILRLTLISDLRPRIAPNTQVEDGGAEIGGMPLLRSDTLVEYGPVTIGGKTYICPIESVSISRSRTIKILNGLPGEFRTFGPFATFLNDVSFGDYHVFRGESRILSGFTQDSNER